MTTRTASATRKVSISLTIEVDQDAWSETYGDERPEIRDAVKAYVLNLVQECSASDEGAFTAATSR